MCSFSKTHLSGSESELLLPLPSPEKTQRGRGKGRAGWIVLAGVGADSECSQCRHCRGLGAGARNRRRAPIFMSDMPEVTLEEAIELVASETVGRAAAELL